jgi:uncharacterized protein YndB with AHSA1/START domain
MTMTTPTDPVPTLKLERVFDATPDRLWTFWTDPRKYAKWLNPNPGDLKIQEFDVRVGGRVAFLMPLPDGKEMLNEGVFHKLDPYREIVTGDADKSFLITVRFEPVGTTQTRLKVEIKGVPPEWHAAATEGWNKGFDKLQGRVEAGRRTYPGRATLERTFKAPVEKLWEMWTTKEGLEKWYWPEGLVGKVLHLDVRVGGAYEIAAEGLAHTSRGTYTAVEPRKRLAYVASIDFIQDAEPYSREDVVEFHAVPGGTRMVLTSTGLHDPKWQEMSAQGWGGSFDKLDRALAGAQPTQPRQGFTLERTFRAAPEKVWKMWTTKEGLEKWFIPEGMTTRVTKLDLRVAGEYAIEFTAKPGEPTLVNHGVYVALEPPRHLAMIWRFDIYLKPGEKPYDVPITVDLHPTPEGGTRMVFRQGPLATAEFTEGSRQGVASNFEKLAKALGE